jgi:hypothetical protein
LLHAAVVSDEFLNLSRLPFAFFEVLNVFPLGVVEVLFEIGDYSGFEVFYLLVFPVDLISELLVFLK